MVDKELSWRGSNPTYGVTALPRRQQEIITLVDAGLDYNLPLVPLFKKEREIDLIIVLDASAAEPGKELRKAEGYFNQRGIKFPKINYDGIDKKIASVFKDEKDPKVPVIIYMPQIKNPTFAFDPASCQSTFCNTFNFVYQPEQAKLLIESAKRNMLSSKDVIFNEIKSIIDKKK